MLTRSAYIIHSITPSQTENERDLTLSGIYTESCCANISIEILSDLLFISRNSAAFGRNTTIDIFGGSLDSVSNIFDKMESNLDVFEDAGDTGEI